MTYKGCYAIKPKQTNKQTNKQKTYIQQRCVDTGAV